jgi:hypothetical protein
MIRWKDSCRFDHLHPAMVLATVRVDQLYGHFDVPECWITSANDSGHMIGSRHYDGRGLDFRTHVIPHMRRQEVREAIARALGPQFTVILEDFGGPNEHLHIQFNGV